MLQYVLRRAFARAATITTKPKSAVLPDISCRSCDMAVLRAKFYGTIGVDEPHCNQVAQQMIQYALGHARSQKSGDSYTQSLMVLEQGISNLRGGESTEDALGMLMLAMSTLLYERGGLQDSIEKLQMVHDLDGASLAIKVAAWEALIGLNLEAGQDSSSLALSNECFQLLNSSSGGNSVLEAASSRARAIKGLAHLILGELKSAEALFSDCKVDFVDSTDQTGNPSLSYGEFSHATGNLSLAEDLYEKVLRVPETQAISDNSFMSSSNMVSEEVLLGATCALGQLLSHLGKFNEAEELLTKALTKAESHFGTGHPKVGVILTCIALMYKQKAKFEASSATLIQEGLYRRALDMLKAPALDSRDSVNVNALGKRDIIALARGGYAETLCIQQKRKGEGERMRKWAEANWRNRRMSLAEALEISQPSKFPVVDTRIFRLL